jgi:arylsulfatase A-like enzyme
MNILYLHCHDAGRYIQPYGHGVATPNLQKLAETGVLFRNAFNVGPTCSPSRASLVTGQYPHVNGMLGLAHRGYGLNNYGDHIIHQLHEQGYTSALSGTQHIADNTDDIGYQHVLMESAKPKDMSYAERDLTVAQRAADWILAGQKKPFFLSVGFFYPHRPFLETEESTGPDEDPRFVKVPPTLPDTEQTRQDMADYNRSVKYMDKCCGMVLDALDQAGLTDDTLIIATTDHGIAFPKMKCTLSDHGTGVYLMIKGPRGFEGGRCVDAMVSHLDIYPTICDLLEIDPNHTIHGKSLMPLIEGEADRLHNELFNEINVHAHHEPTRSVRTDRYKLIKRFDPMQPPSVNCDNGHSKACLCEHGWSDQQREIVELYDLIFDPTEAHNLLALHSLGDGGAHDPDLEPVRKGLENKLKDWMQSTNDPPE